MSLNKKITSQIWDNCSKQIVDGYVYVKMDDIIKLSTDHSPLIEEKPTKIDMNQIATYLNSEGWIYERNPDTGEIWRRRPGDYKNRKRI
jgi:hypothetical protein